MEVTAPEHLRRPRQPLINGTVSPSEPFLNANQFPNIGKGWLFFFTLKTATQHLTLCVFLEHAREGRIWWSLQIGMGFAASLWRRVTGVIRLHLDLNQPIKLSSSYFRISSPLSQCEVSFQFAYCNVSLYTVQHDAITVRCNCQRL